MSAKKSIVPAKKVYYLAFSNYYKFNSCDCIYKFNVPDKSSSKNYIPNSGQMTNGSNINLEGPRNAAKSFPMRNKCILKVSGWPWGGKRGGGWWGWGGRLHVPLKRKK